MKAGTKTLVFVFVLGALGAFASAMAYRWLERGGTFDLTTVRVRGIRSADSATVCASVAPLFGTSIWKIDGDSLGRAMEDLPGITAVRMSRIPFRTILLDISLDRPVFVVSDGHVPTPVSVTGERLPASFLSDTLPVVETVCRMDSATSAGLGLWFSEGAAGEGVLSLQYTADGVAVMLDGGRRVILGDTALEERWSRFTELSRLAPETAGWTEIDMRYGGQAVLRMGGG
jgi:cell division septal protein FtsQ